MCISDVLSQPFCRDKVRADKIRAMYSTKNTKEDTIGHSEIEGNLYAAISSYELPMIAAMEIRIKKSTK